MKSRQPQFSLRRLPTLALFAVALAASAYGLSDAWHVHVGDGSGLVHGHRHLGAHQHGNASNPESSDPVSDPVPAESPDDSPGSGPESLYVGIASAASTPEVGIPVESPLRPAAHDRTLAVENGHRSQIAIAPRTSRGPPA